MFFLSVILALLFRIAVSRCKINYFLLRSADPTGWKADSLSQAGKLVLIKSVLQSVPVHTFLSSWNASSILSKLERLNRSFFWKKGDGQAMHLISWDFLQRLKSMGGLGIKNLDAFSIALSAPNLLKLLNKENSPWVNLMLAKYDPGPSGSVSFPGLGGNWSLSQVWFC